MMQITLTPEAPSELSKQLREEGDPFLAHRRAVAALGLVATGAMGVISLFQLGIIRHLPDPPGPLFASDRIDASDEAYTRLSTPDAALALANYSVTVVLAAMGGRARAREAPWIPLAMAAKLGFDVAQGIRLSIQQWTKYRSFCFWCLTAAGASFASVPFVMGETREALRNIRHNSH
jgi:uncharacterized membrane protein